MAMNDEISGAPPQEAPRKASAVRIILMLALGGPIIAVGGCALFLANMRFEGSGGNDGLSAFGALVFVGGCLAFVVGIIWAVARWIDRRFEVAAAVKKSVAANKSNASNTTDQANTTNPTDGQS
jgi:uncharacterized iron-regulated membrane protein